MPAVTVLSEKDSLVALAMRQAHSSDGFFGNEAATPTDYRGVSVLASIVPVGRMVNFMPDEVVVVKQAR